MNNDKELIDALKIFGQGYIDELEKQLKLANKDASGKLIRSLDSRVIKTAMGTLYTIQLKAEDYLKYVDSGRRAGAKPPPVSALKPWLRIKGIPQGAAYPIARSIGERGIKATNVISKSLKAVQRGAAFRGLEDGMSDWVDDMVNDMLLDISKNNNITVRAK